MQDKIEAVVYNFKIKKSSAFKGKALLNLNASGKFSLSCNKLDAGDLSFIFTNMEYNSINTKDPLIFNPVTWHYNWKLNLAAITEKKSFKPLWNNYRNKHSNTANKVQFLVLEKLYFETPLGMEYDTFSNGVYLPFFNDSKGMYLTGEHYRGLDLLLMPLNIPVKTKFLCKELNDREVLLEGCIEFNEEVMEKLLSNQNFKVKARSYHFSLDFSIDSKIEIVIERITNVIKKITCRNIISGADELFEETNYEVCTDFDSYHGGIHKIVDDKKYTIEEWEELERERKKPGRNFSLLDD